MGIRALLAKPFASLIVARHNRAAQDAAATQAKVLGQLVKAAQNTAFGQDHGFAAITTHAQFCTAVPVRDYEAQRNYINRVVAGEADILWAGKPLYLAKTSGTTSGVKYIPISKQSIKNHICAARDALLFYVYNTGNAAFLDRKMIFLSGSPELEQKNGLMVGRLSGIVNHHIPAYLRRNQLPSAATNCMEDWEHKLDEIIKETLPEDLSLISGIPPWVQMYFDRIKIACGKNVGEVFPNFELFVYGGVNFEPYKRKLLNAIGRPINTIELFPASEGFFAFQDRLGKPGMRLILDAGIYYEFIPSAEVWSDAPTRLHIGQVEVGKTYALVISNNAGLWAYSVGDLVRFIDLAPPRLEVVGRTTHFISAFGEHVIGTEVEQAMRQALELFPQTSVAEFTVAPVVINPDGLPHHEWLVEFGTLPHNLPAFEQALDTALQKLNIYYKDLLTGSILETLHVTVLPAGSFANYMRSCGKLGGQNKVPRLANDRNLAEALISGC